MKEKSLKHPRVKIKNKVLKVNTEIIWITSGDRKSKINNRLLYAHCVIVNGVK